MQVRMGSPSVATARLGNPRRRASPPERILREAGGWVQTEASTAVAGATSPPVGVSPRAWASPDRRVQGQSHAHSSRRLHPEANPPDPQPNDPRHRVGIPPATAHLLAGPDGHLRRHPPVAAPFRSIDQTAHPMAQHHAGGVVDVHPSFNVTDADDPTHVPVASRSTQWTDLRSQEPRETDP